LKLSDKKDKQNNRFVTILNKILQ